jgi:hypothetical protein
VYVVTPSIALVAGDLEAALDSIPARFEHVETVDFPGVISVSVQVLRDSRAEGQACT